MITVYHRRRPFFQRQGIVNTRGPFLESSGNLSTPKSNIEIKSSESNPWVLANPLVHLVSLTVS